MNDYKNVAYALRCSASVNNECKEDCPYRVMEEIKPDFLFPLPANVTINGVGYWISCDCDRMSIDAADMITELRNELCYRCGQYAEAHLGSCDGCKWRDG